MTEYISNFLTSIDGGVLLVYLALEFRHTDRFGKDRGPMPPRVRSFLLWAMFILTLALTGWELHRGNTLMLS